MPSHSGLLTKKLKIKALRQVCEAAVNSSKALNDEEKRLRMLMCTSNSNRGSMNLQESTERNQQQHNGAVKGNINCTPYQAESTLSRYNGGGSNDSQPNPHNLPWRLGQDGKKYTSNHAELDYLSMYPLGFKGCFKYGSSAHYKREDYSIGSVKDRRVLDIFFKEFKIHKPNYENRKRDNSVSQHDVDN